MNVKKPAAVVIGLCTLLMVAACGSSHSESTTTAAHSLSATLTPQAVVTPRGKPFAVPASLAHATGEFSSTLSDDNKLSWHLSFAKLGSPGLVVADIHVGPPKKFGPVLLRLCASCKPSQNGVLKLKASDTHQLIVGKQWVTVITDKYPNGALRGQIAVK
jgi:CHRD domain